MRTHASRYLLVLVASLAFLLPAARSSADAFDDFVWLLEQVESTGASPFPVSSGQLASSKDLILCLADDGGTDVGVAGCIADTQDTALSQQIPGVGAIPGWIYDVVDLYIAIRAKDYWGIVENAGEAALCFAANIATGGTVDVCALLKELVAIGEAMLDIGKAFAEFFKGIGEGAVVVAEEIGCAIGVLDCDSNESPPEQIAYAWVFQPKIPDGVTAREQVDSPRSRSSAASWRATHRRVPRF